MKKILFTLSICFFLFSGNLLAQSRGVLSCPSTVKDIDGNEYNTVLIGNQCWMKENLRTSHYSDGTSIALGNSLSYDIPYNYLPPTDELGNLVIFGYLYNWKAVMRNSAASDSNPSGVQGICPNGWHVPSKAEWNELFSYVKSQNQYTCDGDSSYIAKALTTKLRWNSSTNACTPGHNPNGNDNTGFSVPPAGTYEGYTNLFGTDAFYWTATGAPNSHNAYSKNITYNEPEISTYINDKALGFSVRCLRNYGEEVVDFDGNSYPTVQLGAQCWMKENLRTSHYSDGTPIEFGDSLSYDVPYRYSNSIKEGGDFSADGYLYNWNAVMHGAASSDSNPSGVQGICPKGWHVPSKAEWKQLVHYIRSHHQYLCNGDSNHIANALASNQYWAYAEAGCTPGNDRFERDISKFSAVPAGAYAGDYESYLTDAFYWCATGIPDSNKAYSKNLTYNEPDISTYLNDMACGFSVRCVKDPATPKEAYQPKEEPEPETDIHNRFDKNEIVRFPDEAPAYPGGEEAMNEFLQKKLKYPAKASKDSIQGAVFVEFVIETDGKVSNPKVTQGLSDECDKEACRVVLAMPKWTPGTVDGEPVRSIGNAIINFKPKK